MAAQNGAVKKPRALRVLEGGRFAPGQDSGGRPILPPAPFERGAPEPPSVITGDPVAMAEWESVVGTLVRLNLVKPQDLPTLVAYCRAYSDYIASCKMYDAEPTPRTWKIRQECDRLLHRWVRELGLSPSAEAIWEKPIDDGPEDENPFD